MTEEEQDYGNWWEPKVEAKKRSRPAKMARLLLGLLNLGAILLNGYAGFMIWNIYTREGIQNFYVMELTQGILNLVMFNEALIIVAAVGLSIVVLLLDLGGLY